MRKIFEKLIAISIVISNGSLASFATSNLTINVSLSKYLSHVMRAHGKYPYAVRVKRDQPLNEYPKTV